MGICKRCGKETQDTSVLTCDGNTTIQYPDGETRPAVAYDPKKAHLPQWFRCPDCNIAPGGIHHLNCDQESCPKCGGQLISCDCF
jgi:hypothetical protein